MTIHIGRLSIHPSVLLYPVVGGIAAGDIGLFAGLLGLVALALHECGHVAATHLMGLRVLRAHLSGAGGYIALGTQGASLQRILIAAAGPLTNTACMLPALPFVLARRVLIWDALTIWAAAHAAFAIVNMLPTLPFDGGRVLLSVFERAASPVLALRTMSIVGILLGVALTIVGSFASLLAVGWRIGIVGVGLSALWTAVKQLWGLRRRRGLLTRTAGDLSHLSQQVVPPYVPAHRVRGITAVVVEGRILGVVLPGRYHQGRTVAHVMQPVMTVSPSTTLWVALRIMAESEQEVVAVCDDGRFLGLLTLADCERAAF